MVFIAALTCRISMQIAGQPASDSPSCSQAVSKHAAIPTRSSGRSSGTSASSKAPGATSVHVSSTIAPVASTTQIAVSPSDTPNPPWHATAAPLQCLRRSTPTTFQHPKQSPPPRAAQPQAAQLFQELLSGNSRL
jgi:hypothetical protein